MADKLAPKQSIRFIRVRGRVIPVRRNVSVKKGKGLLTRAGVAAEGKRRVTGFRRAVRNIPLGDPFTIDIGTHLERRRRPISGMFKRSLAAAGQMADNADFLAGTGVEKDVARRFAKKKNLKSAKPGVWTRGIGRRTKIGLGLGALGVASAAIAVKAANRE